MRCAKQQSLTQSRIRLECNGSARKQRITLNIELPLWGAQGSSRDEALDKCSYYNKRLFAVRKSEPVWPSGNALGR